MGKSQRKTRPTIHDVAKAAGVAVGSASRALNNHPDVTPELRDRITAAAQFLNYTRLRKRVVRRGGRAGSAGNRQTAAIGLICFGMEDALVALPVVSAALHGIEGAVATEGGTLMFASIPGGDRVPAFLSENRVAGVIVKGPNQGDLPTPAENELLRHIYRLPHVWLLGRPPNGLGDHCNFDTGVAGRLAADHLYAKGHRHVAFLNPKPGHAQFESVKRAFCDQSRTFGSTADLFESEQTKPLTWPLPGITSPEKVDQLVQRWAQQPKTRRATALAVGADITAVQIYSALHRLGLRVGRDVSLISCNDDKSLVIGLNPPLTTIDVHAEAIDRNAVARLLWRIAHPAESSRARILVEPVLIERGSVQTLN